MNNSRWLNRVSSELFTVQPEQMLTVVTKFRAGTLTLVSDPRKTYAMDFDNLVAVCSSTAFQYVAL